MPQAPKILFSSVFKPFAEADNLYSRLDSKIEIYHNQLTKYQGIFSPRAHYNTFGLHVIANNLGIPSVVMDFPTLPRFIEEVKNGYDYVGIGSIMPNFQKAKRMAEEVRKWSPKTKIIIGGFCAAIENLDKMLPVDYICVGEGISFMRELLGLSPEFDFRQPDTFSEPRELLGVPLFWAKRNAVLLIGLGCPYACDFCSPSHFFGKKHIKFFKTGEHIYREMSRLSRLFRNPTITFMGDDNFLADHKRARELRESVLKGGKQFNIFIFASADQVSQWEPEELAEMNIATIWIGRESKFAPYPKNKNVNLKGLVQELRRVGISVVLSSILLMDFHTRQNIWEDIEDHLAVRPAFSQFSFYAPAPGTPLYARLKNEGRLLANIPLEEWHAFKQPVFIHPEFSLQEAEKLQERAFREDFFRLGPGIVRLMAAELEGYLNLRQSPKPFLRERAEFIARNFPAYRAVLKACEHLVPGAELAERVRELEARLAEATRGISAFERLEALGIYAFGRLGQARHRLLGDALQPKTRITYYPGTD
jgi:hypothetical protein